MTYQHVHSHQDDPHTVLKIHKGIITIKQAEKMAENSGEMTLLNIVRDKAASRGWRDYEVGRANNTVLPKEVRVVLGIKGHSFSEK